MNGPYLSSMMQDWNGDFRDRSRDDIEREKDLRQRWMSKLSEVEDIRGVLDLCGAEYAKDGDQPERLLMFLLTLTPDRLTEIQAKLREINGNAAEQMSASPKQAGG